MRGFPPSVFEERRNRALAELGHGAMVLPSTPVLRKGTDTELRYRPDSELFYLTGSTEPGSLLVLRGSADSARSVIFVQPRDADAERWTGPKLGPEQAQSVLGVDEARSVDRLESDLDSLLAGADRIYYRLGVDERMDRRVLSAFRSARKARTQKGHGPDGVMDPGVILDEMRLRKDAYEIDAIRHAASITVQGFLVALDRLRPGMGEWEVEADLEGTFRRLGADGPAFPSIVGSGANGCILHYIANSARMDSGDLVLLDAGAECRMYGGDVSRTVPVGGRFTPEQRSLYGVVEAARRAAVEEVGPGVTLDQVHRAAVRVMVGGLRELGVLSGPEDELMEMEAHRPFFPHRTSHWLGLDTHDVGRYAQDGESRTLEPGMVLTIEPGLYFPADSGIPRFDGMGVRIEDDVLVTEDGREVLDAGLPTGAEEIESLVGRDLAEVGTG